jgi:type IV pilus assembly protein PilA
MIHINNKKGVSLIELLITLALMGVIAPILFTIFINGIDDFASCSNYMDQQYRMQDVIRQIRQDVEAAKLVSYEVDATVAPGSRGEQELLKVKFTFLDNSTRTWRFNDTTNVLELSTDDGANYIDVVNKIDGSSCFKYYEDASGSEQRIRQLILQIKTLENTGLRNKARNIKDEIITEFSVRYKTIEIG